MSMFFHTVGTMKKLTIISAIDPERSDHIDKCAQSVHAVFPHLLAANWQVQWCIVVDGPGEVKRFKNNEFVNYYRLPVKVGVAAARNWGLARASGDWVFNLDVDDALIGSSFVELLSHQNLDQAQWVVGNVSDWDGNQEDGWSNSSRVLTPETFPRLGDITMPNPAGLLVKKQTLVQAGGWPAIVGGESYGLLLKLGTTTVGSAVPWPLVRKRIWDKMTSKSIMFADQEKMTSYAVELLCDGRS